MLDVSSLSDLEVTTRLVKQCAEERLLITEFISVLSEVEERKLYLLEGYGSLFAYCTRKLKLSESSANRRIRAARVFRKCPEVIELLKQGEINLSTLSQVASLVLAGEREGLIQQIRGKSQREVEELIAVCKPEVKVKEVVRPVHCRARKAEPEATDLFSKPLRNRSEGLLETAEVEGSQRPEPKTSDVEEPELRYELKFSVDKACKEKLAELQGLLSHKHPLGMSLEQTFEFLVDDYLKKNSLKRKKAKNKKSKRAGGKKRSSKNERYVPKGLVDEVYRRDNHSCSYVGTNGSRCCSTWQLELDHIVPLAKGGRTESANLRLLCGTHNLLEAEREFGKGFIAGKICESRV